MKILSLIILFLGLTLNAQASKSISVMGDVVKPLTISFNDLKSYQTHSLDSLVIYNHKMEYKSTLKKISGVLLKDVLAKIDFKADSPKLLSEFYLVCIADDGYKVVFSWNEIFNSRNGDQALIVTELNGSDVSQLKENIMLVTPTDKATGRRYVKNLSGILIQQVK
ncbi:molybdopterin-binding protein [Chryseobacterium sp. Leaf405]|uniref:molybdopterin-binding protein n=1 Tax=Chryseobacterium sp. Leaf405 TaxID=1736367 RepID=UPI0006FCDD66|nr:molybdopterin-binding protein [Chryseobacterium sp. Leaf405]KQT26134.1 molybdopterin-binding protein [Chryseobacterium sp. Leaf405]